MRFDASTMTGRRDGQGNTMGESETERGSLVLEKMGLNNHHGGDSCVFREFLGSCKNLIVVNLEDTGFGGLKGRAK